MADEDALDGPPPPVFDDNDDNDDDAPPPSLRDRGLPPPAYGAQN